MAPMTPIRRSLRAMLLLLAPLAGDAFAEERAQDKSEPLVLEYTIGSITQRVLVEPNRHFYVASVRQRESPVSHENPATLSVSGVLGPVLDGGLDIRLIVKRYDAGYGDLASFRLRLKIDEFPGKSSGGVGSLIGGEPLQHVWLHRGIDPLPHMKSALASRKPHLFLPAAQYLPSLGPAAQRAAALLLAALEADDPQIRAAAIPALAAILLDLKQGASELADDPAAQHADEQLAEEVREKLQQSILDALNKSISDPNGDVQTAAEKALQAVDE